MSKPKPYFHDRLVLLVVAVNTFLMIACVIVALLPLTDTRGTIIAEYRSNLGLDGYRAGSVGDIISFGIFAVLIYVFQMYVSIKLYEKNKQLSVVVLVLSTILLLFTLIVCNALIELR